MTESPTDIAMAEAKALQAQLNEIERKDKQQ